MGKFAQAGATCGAKADVWWPAGLSATGSVLALVGPFFGQLSGLWLWRSAGLVVGIFGVLLASVLPITETIRHESALKVAHRQLANAMINADELEIDAKIKARES